MSIPVCAWSGSEHGAAFPAHESAHSRPACSLPCCRRPVKEKVEIGSWNTIGGQVDPKVEALVEAHESFKYSKS